MSNITPTFRDLVERARRRGRKATTPPISMEQIAKRCGVSRVHLYNLMGGSMVAQAHTEALLSIGLRVSIKRVQKALLASREGSPC